MLTDISGGEWAWGRGGYLLFCVCTHTKKRDKNISLTKIYFNSTLIHSHIFRVCMKRNRHSASLYIKQKEGVGGGE